MTSGPWRKDRQRSSGHLQRTSRCPLSANSGHSRALVSPKEKPREILPRVLYFTPAHQSTRFGRELLRRIRANEFTATRAGAADLDHCGLAYLDIVSDVCGLGIEASAGNSLRPAASPFAVAGVPGAGKDRDLA